MEVNKDFNHERGSKFKNFSKKVNEYLNETVSFAKKNPKVIAIRYAILIGIFIGLLLIDQLTKTFLFDAEQEGKSLYDFRIFGIRSIWHFGVTVISKKNWAVIIIVQIVSVLISVGILLAPLFTKAKKHLVVLAFILAGAFGNMLDRFIFNGKVKDIIYIPIWEEKVTSLGSGTFNFADLWIITGCIMLAINFINALINENRGAKKSKDNQNDAFLGDMKFVLAKLEESEKNKTNKPIK